MPDESTESALVKENMKTSKPTISNLEPGIHTFVLKVTDEKGQTSEDEVNIYVQESGEEEKDYPPTVNAGKDIVIQLPVNEVTLNGNQSSDDVGIVNWEWTMKKVSLVIGRIYNTQYICGSMSPYFPRKSAMLFYLSPWHQPS